MLATYWVPGAVDPSEWEFDFEAAEVVSDELRLRFSGYGHWCEIDLVVESGEVVGSAEIFSDGGVQEILFSDIELSCAFETDRAWPQAPFTLEFLMRGTYSHPGEQGRVHLSTDGPVTIE